MGDAELDSRFGSPSVAVTGAAGFIGQYLLKSLSADIGCLCLYRRRLPESYPNVFPVYSDLQSREQLIGFLKNRETVVHLAWEKSFFGYHEGKKKNKSGESENIVALRNLISAMEYTKVQRLIFVSSVGAERNTRVPFLREKYQAEHEILNSQIPEKIIIRASVVFDGSISGGKFVNSVRRLMKLPGLYPIPRNKSTMSPLHVEDLCAVIRRAILRPLAMPASILDVVGGEVFRVDELLKIVSDNLQEYRIPLGSLLGDLLISLIERDSEKKDEYIPRLKFLVDPVNSRRDNLRTKNPLVDVLPDNMKSFRENLFHLTDV